MGFNFRSNLLGPREAGPYGGFFYGLGGQPLWGQQKASKLEEAAGHIADFTFPFGMLFLLALASVIGPVEAITSFPPVA